MESAEDVDAIEGRLTHRDPGADRARMLGCVRAQLKPLGSEMSAFCPSFVHLKTALVL